MFNLYYKIILYLDSNNILKGFINNYMKGMRYLLKFKICKLPLTAHA